MALGKLTPQEEVAEPTPEETLAAEQEKVRQLEAKLQAQQAAEQARREEQERLLGQKFQQAQQLAPQQAQAAELYQAQAELEISDEDLLGENAAQNIRKLIDHTADKRANEKVAGIAPVVGGLVQQSYASQLQALSSHPFYEDVGPLVEQYFASNQDQLLVPGRIQSVFNEIVGANMGELQTREATRQTEKAKVEPQIGHEQAHSGPKAPPLPAINTSPAVRDVGIKPPATGPSVSPEAEYLMNAFNRYGADLDANEWDGISKGKLLPKNRAADWQKGRPEDANVTNYESRDFDPATEA